MNYNFSNSINLAPFLTSKNGNKAAESQLLFFGTFLLKNSHFNSFETVIVVLLITMENKSKLSKRGKSPSSAIWIDFVSLSFRCKKGGRGRQACKIVAIK